MKSDDEAVGPQPEYGRLRGRLVRLSTAAEELSPDDLVDLVVDTPDGEIRPYRFNTQGDDCILPGSPPGVIYLI